MGSAPPRESRILIVCFDGTFNSYDDTNTNVPHLFSLFAVDNPDKQISYYQPGIGTYFKPGVVSPVFELGAMLLDAAFAWYLDDHVMQGYRFLMANHRKGDKICIFGFSRGSYEARALAGMLSKIGLLQPGNLEHINFAFKLYKRTDADGVKLAKGFKATFSHSVNVAFLGVWDTVAQVGLLGTSLPFTNSNSDIDVFRHALSLDEHRGPFRPNLFHATDSPNPSEDPSKANPSGSPPDNESMEPLTDVKEVWFAGCHGDVGGGAVKDDVTHSLSYISLAWMLREIVDSGMGIQFKEPSVLKDNVWSVLERPGSADEAIDLVQPLHDDLVITNNFFLFWFWWLLEFVPVIYKYQDKDNRWRKSWLPNFGRGRIIPTPEPQFHVTVKERMSKDPKYKPKARWTAGTEVYVR